MMNRIIFHIDVNSAFLSWSALEKLENGSSTDLREIPSIIGGDQKSRHGVVLAKSIPAKKYGIVTGEPVASAFRKCPDLVMESPDHRLYSRRSHELMELLHTISPDIEQVSIDECYLDFTEIAHLYPSPVEAAVSIRDRIFRELHFTVNIGISSVRVLAKMASDFTKPNRVHTLFPEEIPGKMWPLPVSDLFMVGRQSAQRLRQYGIFTIGDLAHTDTRFLKDHFKAHGLLMWEYANGIDDTPVSTQSQEAKGIGNSTTLREDAADEESARKVLLSLCESVSFRLRQARQLAQTVTVEIKYADFTKSSHQTQLLSPSSTTDAIYTAACSLFSALWDGRPIRLLGVRSSRLLSEDAPIQLSIFDLEPAAPATSAEKTVNAKDGRQMYSGKPDIFSSSSAHKKEGLERPSSDKLKKLDEAMDQIRRRYGKDAVVRGTFLKDPTQED